MLDGLKGFWRRFKSHVGAYWVDYNLASSDGFFGLDYLMVAGGLHLKSTNPNLRRWWNLYRGFIMLTLPMVSWKLIVNLRAGKQLDVTLQCALIVLGTITTLVRTGFSVRDYELIMAVRRYVNGRRFGRNLASTLPIRAAGFYNIRWTVAFLSSIQLFFFFPFMMMDLTQNDTFGLPFDLRGFSKGLHILVEKFFCFMVGGLACNNLMNNALVYVILKGLLTELTVIAECFEGLMDRAVNRTLAKLESSAGPCKTRHHIRQRYFWFYLHQEFRECIRLHQQMLNALLLVRPLLNVTFLITYYSTMLNIAFGTIFLLSTDLSQVDPYSCQVFYYVGLLMLECWILTHLVTKMTDVNETIGDNVYALNWPEQMEFEAAFAQRYCSTLGSMTMVMTRARFPLRLNCFGFFEFTLDRFAELVNLAYSLVMFFRNFA